MIIFKNLKNVPKGKFPNNVIIQVAKGGSMTSELMNTWKREVCGARAGAIWKPPSSLVYDSVSSHTRKATIASFKQHYNTTLAMIPGGMTPLLQPADSHWNKTFKSAMKHRWLERLQSGVVEYTKSGNRKRAPYSLVAGWVSECCNEVPEDMISRSFIECELFPLRGHGLEELHRKLRSVWEENVNAEEEDSHTGITDEEDVSEEERSDEDRNKN